MTFDLFWQAYPRKIGKLAAQKAWGKATKQWASPETIIAGIEPYKEHKPEWQDYCHPATWLNQGRWMDEYEVPAWQTTVQTCRYCKQALSGSTTMGMHPACYDDHTRLRVVR